MVVSIWTIFECFLFKFLGTNVTAKDSDQSLFQMGRRVIIQSDIFHLQSKACYIESEPLYILSQPPSTIETRCVKNNIILIHIMMRRLLRTDGDPFQESFHARYDSKV